MAAAKSKDDPLEKLGALIDEKVKSAFEGQARVEAEAKDPWARLEGIIDRTVAKHFEAAKGEKPEKSEKPDKPEKKGGGFLELLTGTDE